MSEIGLNSNKRFTCSYKFGGASWSVEVWASTLEEAEMKLRAIGKGKVDGQILAEIPALGFCPTCGRDNQPDHQ